MPDALCKTVPIWIAVLNRVIFSDRPASHVLSTPEDVVSRSEHAQIEEKLPQFVSDLSDLGLDVECLRSKMKGKPVRALWVTPDSELSVPPGAKSDSNYVVLCTASGRTMSRLPDSFEYVQGAADDHESWALGLTPSTLWMNWELLLPVSEEDVPEIITGLTAAQGMQIEMRQPILVRPTANIWVCNNASAESSYQDFDIVISCAEKPSDRLLEVMKDAYIHLPCGEGKNGSRQLRKALSSVGVLSRRAARGSKMLVSCPTGRDLAIGTALALICLCCTDDGGIRPLDSHPDLSKTLIRRRLSWLMVSVPDASPSRATLQSVNAFLLS